MATGRAIGLIFSSDALAKGLVVFIHGGYWLESDKSGWSHLAKGAVSSGYAVAMPSYTLCPDIRIAGIVREIGAAIGKAAAMVDGPLMLTGHSAGGHLASRMVTTSTPLATDVAGAYATSSRFQACMTCVHLCSPGKCGTGDR